MSLLTPANVARASEFKAGMRNEAVSTATSKNHNADLKCFHPD
jgi:hypothetical protein